MFWKFWMSSGPSGALSRQPPGAEAGGAKRDRGGRSGLGMPWLVQRGDKWSLSDYFGETAADSCIAWLSAQAQCIFFFFLMLWVWSYLLWQTSRGDHPSFDNLENDCIGRRVEGGIERERDWVRIENICSVHL